MSQITEVQSNCVQHKNTQLHNLHNRAWLHWQWCAKWHMSGGNKITGHMASYRFAVTICKWLT